MARRFVRVSSLVVSGIGPLNVLNEYHSFYNMGRRKSQGPAASCQILATSSPNSAQIGKWSEAISAFAPVTTLAEQTKKFSHRCEAPAVYRCCAICAKSRQVCF